MCAGIFATILIASLGASDSGQGSAAREIEVSIPVGDERLAASLLLPAERVAPLPGLVLLPGSGPQTREQLRPVAERLGSLGFATLIFDKRGTGGSTGSWGSQSLRDLASDGAAAARWLRSREEVDRDGIGIWAVSQSGWYAPIIANEEPAVRFMIVVSGGGLSPREVEWRGYEEAIRSHGLDPHESRLARSLVRQYFDYLASGEGRQTLADTIENVRSEAWYQAVPIGNILVSDANRKNWEWVATYEPVADIERLSIPVLLLFGGSDHLAPAGPSLERWEAGLRRSNAPPPTVRVFPEAGHALVIGGHGHGAGPRRYAAGCFEMMAAWIAEVVEE